VIRTQPLQKDDEVEFLGPRARDDQPVKFEEMRSGRNSLRGRVVERRVTTRVDPQRLQRSDIRETEGVLGLCGDTMEIVLGSAWPNRFQGKAESDLCNRPSGFQARVQYLEFTWWAPSSAGCGAPQRIASMISDAPHGTPEGFGVSRFKGIEQHPVMTPTDAGHV
jgi:hypothetical protein